ncbi:MAG: MCE family protein [Acidimicrobiaceae bacterium]|nr:MCE family protein [Acidimicrobiaceae bacterium]
MKTKHVHHSRPGLKLVIVKVVVFAGLSALITSIVITSLLDVNVHNATGYYADFSNASGLQKGDTVRIAGVEVGKVGAVYLHGNAARVSFSVDSNQHLTTTTKAAIHYENLLGQRYLSIQPGPGGGKPLRGGAAIPESRTTPALDLTAVFNGFQPLFSALSPDQVNRLAGSIIQVFQGESGTVQSLVAETAAITNNLADRQQVINSLLTSLASLLNSVGSHDTQVGQLIGNFDSLVQSLAAGKGQLGSAITNMASLTQTVSGQLNEAQPALNQDISGLTGATQTLAANQAGIDGVLKGLNPLLNTLTKVESTGNWINVYICNLTVNITGSLDISLVPGVTPPTNDPNWPAPVTLPSGAIGNQSQHLGTCR